MVRVADEDIKALLDLVVGSMDFGSGFLDRDEVDVLRRLAKQVGVNPMDVTPAEWGVQYAHAFVPSKHQKYNPATKDWIEAVKACKHCTLPKNDQLHTQEV